MLNIKLKKSQHGVGMVEVLVAMLILSVGVLGFSMLQVRAIESTKEAFNRTQAVWIIRGLSDSMRINAGNQSAYNTAVNALSNISSLPTPPTPTCLSGSPCLSSDLVNQDAYQAAQAGFNLGIKMGMFVCPGVLPTSPIQQQCIAAAWGNTTPTYNSAITSANPSGNDCMIDTGNYNPTATCMMLEAY
jgi:type IV pilus assembly protein PilV